MAEKQSISNSEKMKNFSDRLNNLVIESGLKKGKVADDVGVSPQTLSNWLAGKYMPSDEELERLAKLFSVSESFLRGKTENPNDQKSNATIVPAEPDGRWVKVISWASAGAARAFEDLEWQIEEKIWSSTKDPNACAIIIEGNSMEPDFRAGDRVVFNPNSLPRNGEDCLVKTDNGAMYFKRFHEFGKNGQSVRLESRNEDYEDIILQKENLVYAYPFWEMIRRSKR